jgi:hypothetical protein
MEPLQIISHPYQVPFQGNFWSPRKENCSKPKTFLMMRKRLVRYRLGGADSGGDLPDFGASVTSPPTPLQYTDGGFHAGQRINGFAPPNRRQAFDRQSRTAVLTYCHDEEA